MPSTPWAASTSNFPYPAKDAYSGLDITTPGCQLLNGAQALAVARARHYEYYANGYWQYDGTSDFGRIQRQDVFIRSLITSAKSKVNPLTVNAFIGSIHEGVTIDDGFGINELIGLALDYRSFDPANLQAQTLPTEAANGFGDLGDVLTVQQPEAQQMLVNTFGSDLTDTDEPATRCRTANPNPPPPVTTTTVAPASPTHVVERNVHGATTTHGAPALLQPHALHAELRRRGQSGSRSEDRCKASARSARSAPAVTLVQSGEGRDLMTRPRAEEGQLLVGVAASWSSPLRCTTRGGAGTRSTRCCPGRSVPSGFHATMWCTLVKVTFAQPGKRHRSVPAHAPLGAGPRSGSAGPGPRTWCARRRRRPPRPRWRHRRSAAPFRPVDQAVVLELTGQLAGLPLSHRPGPSRGTWATTKNGLAEVAPWRNPWSPCRSAP